MTLKLRDWNPNEILNPQQSQKKKKSQLTVVFYKCPHASTVYTAPSSNYNVPTHILQGNVRSAAVRERPQRAAGPRWRHADPAARQRQPSDRDDRRARARRRVHAARAPVLRHRAARGGGGDGRAAVHLARRHAGVRRCAHLPAPAAPGPRRARRAPRLQAQLLQPGRGGGRGRRHQLPGAERARAQGPAPLHDHLPLREDLELPQAADHDAALSQRVLPLLLVTAAVLAFTSSDV